MMLMASPADTGEQISTPRRAVTLHGNLGGCSESPRAISRRPLAGCRILLADRDPDSQRRIVATLEVSGADVTVVENSDATFDTALQSLRCGRPFDVILLDAHLPGLNGHTAATRLRAEGYQAPIVALTSNCTSTGNVHLPASYDDLAAKPLDRGRLVSIILRHFQRTAAKQPSVS